MANLTETATWEPGIYQLETDDPVQGGPGGTDNQQAQQLANRTAYLKTERDTLNTRMGLAEADIDALQATDTAHAASLGLLDGRLDTAEPIISDHSSQLVTLTGRMGLAEFNIGNLGAADTLQQSDIASHEERLDEKDTQVAGLTSASATHTTQIGNHETRITAIEAGTLGATGSIPSATATELFVLPGVAATYLVTAARLATAIGVWIVVRNAIGGIMILEMQDFGNQFTLDNSGDSIRLTHTIVGTVDIQWSATKLN